MLKNSNANEEDNAMEKESLGARIARLEEEVKKLKQAIKPSEAEKIIPEAVSAPGEEPVPLREETIQSIEEPSPSREIPGQSREKWLKLEAIVGERWLVWVGALVFAGGFGVFLKIASEQGWLNEVARFILGLLGGVVLIGFSEFLHKKKFQALAQGLSGLGLTILYLTVFMAYHFYQICGGAISFLLFFTITIGGMSIAMLHNAFPTAFLSILLLQ